MTLKRILVVVMFLLSLNYSTFALAENNRLSDDEIKKIWEQTSQEQIEIAGASILIKLRNKEEAYLVPVYFNQRGRNDGDHSILFRPALREIREVTYPVERDCVVHDLDNDGISEIETMSLGSGQGTTRGVRSIVQFEGWKPIVIHQMEFNDNLGCCGPVPWGCGLCISKEIKWRFVDIDGDGKDNLVEEIIAKQGPRPEKLKTTKNINNYSFKTNLFTKINSNIKLKNR